MHTAHAFHSLLLLVVLDAAASPCSHIRGATRALEVSELCACLVFLFCLAVSWVGGFTTSSIQQQPHAVQDYGARSSDRQCRVLQLLLLQPNTHPSHNREHITQQLPTTTPTTTTSQPTRQPHIQSCCWSVPHILCTLPYWRALAFCAEQQHSEQGSQGLARMNDSGPDTDSQTHRMQKMCAGDARQERQWESKSERPGGYSKCNKSWPKLFAPFHLWLWMRASTWTRVHLVRFLQCVKRDPTRAADRQRAVLSAPWCCRNVHLWMWRAGSIDAVDPADWGGTAGRALRCVFLQCVICLCPGCQRSSRGQPPSFRQPEQQQQIAPKCYNLSSALPSVEIHRVKHVNRRCVVPLALH